MLGKQNRKAQTWSPVQQITHLHQVKQVPLLVKQSVFYLYLTNLFLVDSSTSLFGQVHFQVKGCLVGFSSTIFDRNSCI